MKVAEIVTNQIIEELEKGVIPWREQWASRYQVNVKSKKPYQGINQLLLQMVAKKEKYTSNQWLTFNQAVQLGGSVEGQKSVPVVFWKITDYAKKDDAGDLEVKQSAFMRYYRVFNADQVSGVEFEVLPEPEKIEAEKIASDYLKRENIELTEAGNEAYYTPSEDSITIPSRSQFVTAEDRIGVLFHEMVHSTGHPKRLARRKADERRSFGSTEYSKEELIAELGACLLCYKSGIEQVQQSAAYVQSWLKALKNDRNMIISASSQAEKAANYIV